MVLGLGDGAGGREGGGVRGGGGGMNWSSGMDGSRNNMFIPGFYKHDIVMISS